MAAWLKRVHMCQYLSSIKETKCFFRLQKCNQELKDSQEVSYQHGSAAEAVGTLEDWTRRRRATREEENRHCCSAIG